MRRHGAFVLALLLATSAAADGVTVFADPGLKESLEAVGKAFQAATGHQVAVSQGAGSVLAKHVENGAPADLFIAEGAQALDALEARQLLVPGSRKDVLANELVLIAPATSNLEVRLVAGVDLARVLDGGRLVMPHPDQTIAGGHAKAALTSLGAWDGIVRRVGAAPNSRAVVAAVARGQERLGIVYRTEALAEKRVRIVDTFPAGSHPPIVYTVAQVARMSPPAAFDFADYVTAPPSRAVFERHGFAILR